MKSTSPGQFTIVSNEILDDKMLSTYEKLAYVLLCRFADNHTRECWPSVAKVADLGKMSKRTAFKAIAGLESKGLIEKEGRFEPGSKERASNLYRLIGRAAGAPRSAGGAVPNAAGAPRVVQEVHGGDAPDAKELYPVNKTELNYSPDLPDILDVGGDPSENVADDSPSMTINPVHLSLATRLAQRIEKRDPKYFEGKNRGKALERWANDIRLLIDRDGREPELVASVIDWCQKDLFWKTNILSASKLRKQFPSLVAKMGIPAPATTRPNAYGKKCSKCGGTYFGSYCTNRECASNEEVKV